MMLTKVELVALESVCDWMKFVGVGYFPRIMAAGRGYQSSTTSGQMLCAGMLLVFIYT